MTEPRYPYVVVDVAPELADALSEILFDMGALGVEIRDESTLRKGEAGKVCLVASFETKDGALEVIEALDEEFRPRLEEVIGDAWRDEWKKHFASFELCPGVVIRPPWEQAAAASDGKRVIELEPGRAFGTGLHETTSLVAGELALRAGEYAGKSLLDVGTGSGVLALVALALGAARARCIDIDEDAVLVTQENAARNGMTALIEADTTDVAAITERFPLVLANIEARVLIPLSPAIRSTVAPGGLLILSGILSPQLESVRAAYEGMESLAAPSRGEWAALVLREPLS